MKAINKISVAREQPRVRSDQNDASMRLERTKRKDEHYATEGFVLGVKQGKVIPYLDPNRPDYLDRLAAVADLDVMDQLEAQASDLPLTFGSRLLKRSETHVGIISGATIAGLLEGTANFHQVSPWSSDESLSEIDLLLVGMPVVDREEAWSKAELEQIKFELFPKIRELGLPIVVVTLSDPMRTNATSTLAEDADVLLTTNPDGAELYGQKLAKDVRIEHFQACFNPLYVSPVGRGRHRVQGAMLNGKLPGTGQRQRFQALRGLLTGLRREDEMLVASQGGVVAGLDEKKTGLFPTEFANVLTRDPKPELRSRVLRLMDLHVLAHLHPASSFAHPQETLEVLASGAAAMSTYSVGLNNEYPHVLLPDGPDDAQLQIRLLRSDDDHLRDLQLEGIRRSFNTRTSDRLMRQVLRLVGLETQESKIHVVWLGHDDDSDLGAWRSQIVPEGVEAQRIKSSESVPQDTEIIIDAPVNMRVRHHLIQDAVNGFRMASVDRVLLTRNAPSSSVFELTETSEADEETVVARWVGGGVAEHDSAFLMDGSALSTIGSGSADLRSSQADLSVIVPVYNNGPYLLRKCLESLRRSSAFECMEIILVDDGSTREETRRIVQETGYLWPNVRTHLFPPGGSGSASRPRNHGLTMVRTPWVTYLDPDNEAVGDGYAELLDLCRKTEVDFAIGDMLRYAKTRTLTRNVGILKSVIHTDESGVGEVPEDALTRISFQPMSIQALVAKTEWLKSLNLVQPLGALGQDSLFFQQMLQGAKRIALLDKPIHTYYGEVAGSMVNTVSPSFFRKYLPLEDARSEWLKRDDLFDDYVLKRMRRYVSVWFLPKFNNAVKTEDKDECFELLSSLCEMYQLVLSRSEDGQTATLEDV